MLVKITNIKFHGNSSGRSHAFPCGQVNGGSGMTKLIVAFCSCFTNVTKNTYNIAAQYINLLFPIVNKGEPRWDFWVSVEADKPMVLVCPFN